MAQRRRRSWLSAEEQNCQRGLGLDCGAGRDLGRYAAGARRARTQRGPRHLRPSGRARAPFSHRIEKPVIPPCMPCFAMPHEGEADQLCTTPCISHGHTQLQRQTNQKELAHTSSSTAHPPAAIPHYPHGRFTSRMPAWCSQVRRRRAPRGRLIQRVVDGAGDERRVRAPVAAAAGRACGRVWTACTAASRVAGCGQPSASARGASPADATLPDVLCPCGCTRTNLGGAARL